MNPVPLVEPHEQGCEDQLMVDHDRWLATSVSNWLYFSPLDINMLTEPRKEFDHAIVRLKLRLLRFEPQRTSVAVGALTRIVDTNEGERRIADKRYSLLAVVTTELFPFRDWGGVLVNAYLADNRVTVFTYVCGIMMFVTQQFPLIWDKGAFPQMGVLHKEASDKVMLIAQTGSVM